MISVLIDLVHSVQKLRSPVRFWPGILIVSTYIPIKYFKIVFLEIAIFQMVPMIYQVLFDGLRLNLEGFFNTRISVVCVEITKI